MIRRDPSPSAAMTLMRLSRLSLSAIYMTEAAKWEKAVVYASMTGGEHRPITNEEMVAAILYRRDARRRRL